jgi:membrane protein
MQPARSRAAKIVSAVRDTAVVSVIEDTVTAFGRHNDTTLAAAIAYYTLLSVFPLILGLLALVGAIVSDPSARAQLVGDVAGLFPGATELIQSTVDDVVNGRQAAGLVATAGLIWSAGGVFGAMTLALDRIWHAPRERSIFESAAISILLVLAVGITFIVSLVLSTALEVAVQFRLPLLGVSLSDLPLLLPVLGVALPLVITFGIFALIYWWVPNVRLTWRCAWPGALLAAILFEASKQAFAIYLSRFSHLNAVYGSIGAVIAMITWAYYVAIVFLLGAEFNVAVERRRARARPSS